MIFDPTITVFSGLNLSKLIFLFRFSPYKFKNRFEIANKDYKQQFLNLQILNSNAIITWDGKHRELGFESSNINV